MAQENLAIRRLNKINPKIEPIPNPFQSNFTTPTSMRGIIEAPQQQPLTIPRPRTSQTMNSDMHAVVAEMTLSPTPSIDYMEVSQIDGTKPYIKKLDKPINNMLVNPAIVINDESLNLELGL